MVESPQPTAAAQTASLRHDAIAGPVTPPPPTGSRTETSPRSGLRGRLAGGAGAACGPAACVTQRPTCGRKAQRSSHTPWGSAEPPAAAHGTPGWGREPQQPGAGSGTTALGPCGLGGRGCQLRPGGHPGGPQHTVGPPVLDTHLGYLSKHTKVSYENTEHIF